MRFSYFFCFSCLPKIFAMRRLFYLFVDFSYQSGGTFPQNSFKTFLRPMTSYIVKENQSVQRLARSFGTHRQTSCDFYKNQRLRPPPSPSGLQGHLRRGALNPKTLLFNLDFFKVKKIFGILILRQLDRMFLEKHLYNQVQNVSTDYVTCIPVTLGQINMEFLFRLLDNLY